MATVKPPSRIEPLPCPTFACSWYADVGRSVVAYAGGGGKSRTGVGNVLQLRDGDMEPVQLPLEDVGSSVHIYKNQSSRQLWLIVAVGNKLIRYALPEAEKRGGVLEVGEGEEAACFAVNLTTDKLAVGLFSGVIKVFPMTDHLFGGPAVSPIYLCRGHPEPICCVAFSDHGGRLVSSAKDGTARVWDDSGNCLATLKCSVDDPNAAASAPAPRGPARQPRKKTVVVKGCAFLDMEGRVIMTLAAPRRGKAFLAHWHQKGNDYVCVERIECAPSPVSAFSLNQAKDKLVIGDSGGAVGFWNKDGTSWKQVRFFREVHDFPVTCVAIRPLPGSLPGEQDGVEVAARTASADSKTGCLSLQRRKLQVPGLGGGAMQTIHRLLLVAVIFWVLSPLFYEACDKCTPYEGLGELRRCLKEDFLIAPSSRLGITTPPY